ncbi:MAG: urease subunit beta [Pseudomonadota bacterium]
MRLSPREIDKLILHNAGFLAQKRYARGLRLNYVESVALIASQLQELIREGYTVADLMDIGRKILGMNDVLPDVAEMIHEVQVEGTFPDGTKLVTVHDPISRETGDPDLALYGSGLTKTDAPKLSDTIVHNTPGEIICEDGDVILNEGRKTTTLRVTNMGDRPVQVGSHYPFFEANPRLLFVRKQAYGYRLDIPSGAAVRFEPGESKTVNLVEIAGERTVYGGNGLISGRLSEENLEVSLEKARAQGFLGADDE